jgi:hypothetical protein
MLHRTRRTRQVHHNPWAAAAAGPLFEVAAPLPLLPFLRRLLLLLLLLPPPPLLL